MIKPSSSTIRVNLKFGIWLVNATIWTVPRIIGADALIHAGALILLGEIHGTNEIPRFVAALTNLASCQYAVHLCLEIPSSEQPRIDRFLSSDGSHQEIKHLMNCDFWRRDFQDGRSSAAMLSLIESVHSMNRGGARIQVLAFDEPAARDGASSKSIETSQRDRTMATNITAAQNLHHSSVFIVLAGNLHTQIIIGTPWEPGFKPMGWHLLHLGKSIVSLNNTYDSGTAWLSLVPGICGVQDVKGQFRGKTPFMQILHSRSYHGTFYVGAVTASPPAKQCKH
jgi:hypothetical protein